MRIGKGGRPFKVLKFATMLRDSPNMAGGLYTSKNDPRLLPMGKFLRKTKINELPQLINILLGQMSVIGYRPLVEKEYSRYSEYVKKSIMDCTPGLSGIGSIVFRNEEELLQKFESHEEKDRFYYETIMPYKGNLEVWYVNHKNVFTYFKLIILTIEAVIKGDCNWRKLKEIPKEPKELEDFL